MSNTQVVQTAGKGHGLVGKTVFGVAENIFDHARPFDPGDGMFNPDAHLRYSPIGFFLDFGQFALARLFFGWYVWQPRGS